MNSWEWLERPESSFDDDIPNEFHEENVNELYHMIQKAQTLSVLNQLKTYQKNLTESQFRSLLLSLTEKFKYRVIFSSPLNSSFASVTRGNGTTNILRPRPALDQSQISQCILTVFCYIVAVINKYQIRSVENLWKQILTNYVTRTAQFYQYLHKEKVVIPFETRQFMSENYSHIFASQSMKIQLKLMELGFTFNGMITKETPIRTLENIFSILKQRQISDGNLLKPEEYIIHMNTPEKLSLFLSHFTDYDINQINQINPNTQQNILDQLIRMQPYIYTSDLQAANRFGGFTGRPAGFTFVSLTARQRSELISHPNDIVEHRAVRIVTLIQQLILRGARLSQLIDFYNTQRLSPPHAFYKTSLGIYVLLSLYINGLWLNDASMPTIRQFVFFVLNKICRFERTFEELISNRLALTFSLVHQLEFMAIRRYVETDCTQRINDRLFQRSLKLKDWCRIKIREHYSFDNILQSHLPHSLINYCLFGLYDSDYGLRCVKEVVAHGGNVRPVRLVPRNRNIIPTLPIHDNEEDDGSVSD